MMESFLGLLDKVIEIQSILPSEQEGDGGISYPTSDVTVITLSGDTSYSLDEGKVYRCQISNDTTFILPNVSDPDKFHEIVLSVKFNGVYYATFKNASQETLPTIGQNEWDDGDVVQYLIRYEALLNRWTVGPMPLS